MKNTKLDEMKPTEIITDPAFEDLFPIDPELLKRIEQDMQNGTYDRSQHIILGKWVGQHEPMLMDGHTRLRAAINLNLESVPVFIKDEFASKEEAILHAIKLQCNRRNLTDAELFRCWQTVDELKVQDRDPATGRFTGTQDCTPGKSAEKTAELLGTSPTKVSQMRRIGNQADPETKKAVLKGEKTVNQAYNETRKKRNAAKEVNSPAGKSSPQTNLMQWPRYSLKDLSLRVPRQ